MKRSLESNLSERSSDDRVRDGNYKRHRGVCFPRDPVSRVASFEPMDDDSTRSLFYDEHDYVRFRQEAFAENRRERFIEARIVELTREVVPATHASVRPSAAADLSLRRPILVRSDSLLAAMPQSDQKRPGMASAA